MLICKDCQKKEATESTGRCGNCEYTWQVMYEFGNRPENLPKKRIIGDGSPIRCKVCDKEFVIGGFQAMLTITPDCKCKQVRSRVRREGCPECGEAKIGLTLADEATRIVIFNASVLYIVTCHTCGHTWKVPL